MANSSAPNSPTVKPATQPSGSTQNGSTKAPLKLPPGAIEVGPEEFGTAFVIPMDNPSARGRPLSQSEEREEGDDRSFLQIRYSDEPGAKIRLGEERIANLYIKKR